MSGSFWARLAAAEEKVEFLIRLVIDLRQKVSRLEQQLRNQGSI